MIPRTITVRYSCDGCGLEDREVTVRAREDASEDLGEWMRALTARIGDDHRLSQPNCRATKLRELKIPLRESDGFVGQAQ